jgi:hypothetical protein
MTEFRTVLRPIPVSDRVLEAGEVVDVSGWKTTKQLVRMGRLSEEITKKPTVKVKTETRVTTPEE